MKWMIGTVAVTVIVLAGIVAWTVVGMQPSHTVAVYASPTPGVTEPESTTATEPESTTATEAPEPTTTTEGEQAGLLTKVKRAVVGSRTHNDIYELIDLNCAEQDDPNCVMQSKAALAKCTQSPEEVYEAILDTNATMWEVVRVTDEFDPAEVTDDHVDATTMAILSVQLFFQQGVVNCETLVAQAPDYVRDLQENNQAGVNQDGKAAQTYTWGERVTVGEWEFVFTEFRQMNDWLDAEEERTGWVSGRDKTQTQWGFVVEEMVYQGDGYGDLPSSPNLLTNIRKINNRDVWENITDFEGSEVSAGYPISIIYCCWGLNEGEQLLGFTIHDNVNHREQRFMVIE